MSELKTNKVSPATGTAFTLGDSGDTFTLPSGAIMTITGTLALDATKIADGSVTSTEFQYINTLASNAQTQITARLPLAGGTMSGTIACADQLIARPELKDYSETKVALSAAATVDIDLTTGNVFALTAEDRKSVV